MSDWLVRSLRIVEKLSPHDSSDQLCSQQLLLQSDFGQHTSVFICPERLEIKLPKQAGGTFLPPRQVWQDLIDRTVRDIFIHTVAALT